MSYVVIRRWDELNLWFDYAFVADQRVDVAIESVRMQGTGKLNDPAMRGRELTLIGK